MLAHADALLLPGGAPVPEEWHIALLTNVAVEPAGSLDPTHAHWPRDQLLVICSTQQHLRARRVAQRLNLVPMYKTSTYAQ